MNSWLSGLITIMLQSISGPMREQLIASVKAWEETAKQTASPWDDIVVGMVKWILAIP